MSNPLAPLFVAPPAKDRHNNINLIRFAAASAVIYGHMAILIDAPVPDVFGHSVSSLAVMVFFVLSGYLICESLLRDGNLFRYLVRRVFRIVPALVFVVACSVFVLGPLVTALPLDVYFSSESTWRYLVLNSLMNPQFTLPGVFESNLYPNVVNGSLWTLPVEFAMYLVLPLVLFVLRRFNAEKPGVAFLAVFTAALSLLSEAGVVVFGQVVWGTLVGEALSLVPYFFMGAFVALSPGLKDRFNLQVGFLLALVLAAACPQTAVGAEFMTLLLLPYVILTFSFVTPAVFGRVFAEHDYSYGVYLWAFPVQQTLVMLFGPQAMGLVAYSAVAFALTLLCAMVSWFVVERPAGKLGRKITSWSRARMAAKAA